MKIHRLFQVCRLNSALNNVLIHIDEVVTKVDMLAILLFIMQTLGVIIFTLGWILVDISLSYTKTFRDKGPVYQTATWGVLNVIIGFSVKALTCFNLYGQLFNQTARTWILIVGSLANVLAVEIVRLNLVHITDGYSEMNDMEAMEEWRRVDFAGFGTSVFFCLLIRYMTNYLFLPYAVWYILTKQKLPQPEGQEDKPAVEPTWLRRILASWISLWALFIFISALVYSVLPAMYALLWAPLAFSLYRVVRDYQLQASTDYAKLRYSISYLVLHLWLLDMIPELAANILNNFNDLRDQGVRFIATALYIVLTNFFMFISKMVVEMAGRPGPLTFQIIFGVQFFNTFFELLFFSSSPLFWVILCLQASALATQGSVGIVSLFRYVKRWFIGPPSSAELARIELEEKRKDPVLELIKKRAFIKSRIQQIFQTLLVDATAILVLVTSYYVLVNFMLANSGIDEALAYSFFLGIRTVEQLRGFEYLAQYAIIWAFRSLGNIIPMVYHRKQLHDFNVAVSEINKQSEALKSADLLTMQDAEKLDDKSALKRVPRLNVWKVLFSHLDHGWWFYFALVCLAFSRIGLSVRSVLFASDGRVITEYLRSLYGNSIEEVQGANYLLVTLLRRGITG